MIPITPFSASAKAPYAIGEVPLAGWFAIEPTCLWDIRDTKALVDALGVEDREYTAILTGADLQILADSFDLDQTDGRGWPVTEDHSFLNSANGSSRAAGWVKALHAEGDMLWAWIEWTESGHKSVNEGAFAFFSTEYDYADFVLVVPGQVTPRRLAGLSITNFPNHTGQIPMTNTKQNKPTMPNQKRKSAVPITRTRRNKNNVDPKDVTDPNPDKTGEVYTPDQMDPDKKDANQTDEKDKDKNEQETPASELDAAIELVEDIADALDLSEDATADDVLQAVEDLVEEKDKLQQSLAEANARDANSGVRNTRFPRMFSRSTNSRSPERLRGQAPSTDQKITMGGKNIQVNCQELDKVDYINKHIAQKESTLGRQLTEGAYITEYNKAAANYDKGAR